MAIKAPTTAEVDKMRDQAAIVQLHKTILDDAKYGYDALRQFCRLNASQADRVATISVELTVMSNDRDAAQAYINAAANSMLEVIIQKAVNMAQADFDKAKDLINASVLPSD